MNNVNVFLPIRKSSNRIKNKNTKNFNNTKGGLTFIKISQLLKSKKIDKIIISTDDTKVVSIVNNFKNKKIIIEDRPKNLSKSETSTDDLIKYVPSIINKGIILWTHVTSPFVSEKIYDDMIEKYLQNLNKHDSLMTVTKIQKFLWDKEKPINYDKSIEKWPRTQSIDPIYEINSAAFIADIKIYTKHNDRIGNSPYLYDLNHKQAFDIDWPDDFNMAEKLSNNND